MNDLENNKFITIKDDLNEKCIDKESKENNHNEDNNYDTQEKEDDLSTNKTRLKKLHFFDFFLNNLYNCCKNQNHKK